MTPKWKPLHPNFIAAVRAWCVLRNRRNEPAIAGAIYWDTDQGHTCYRRVTDKKRLKDLALKIDYTGPIWDAKKPAVWRASAW